MNEMDKRVLERIDSIGMALRPYELSQRLKLPTPEMTEILEDMRARGLVGVDHGGSYFRAQRRDLWIYRNRLANPVSEEADD